mmetsp:Transcript_7592/g.25570  ORF Transcript_7592/g.25570 Transcript_7592/m.25570 type:complete len:207 (+) Transcript_7592:360-980(+)
MSDSKLSLLDFNSGASCLLAPEMNSRTFINASLIATGNSNANTALNASAHASLARIALALTFLSAFFASSAHRSGPTAYATTHPVSAPAAKNTVHALGTPNPITDDDAFDVVVVVAIDLVIAVGAAPNVGAATSRSPPNSSRTARIAFSTAPPAACTALDDESPPIIVVIAVDIPDVANASAPNTASMPLRNVGCTSRADASAAPT